MGVGFLCRNQCGVIFFKGQHFDRAKAEFFSGWGHTCWQDDVDIALKTGVSQVLLGHHAPDADDRTLFHQEIQVQHLMPKASMARAGQWINIG